MSNAIPSLVDSEESMLSEGSTAPTTPDGSLSFSPVLRPMRNHMDGLVEDLAGLTGKVGLVGSSRLALPQGAASIPQRVRNICCVGAGYVGGPTASVIAFHNPHIKVSVVDRDATRIRRWNSPHPPIYEPGLGHIVRIARDGSRQSAFLNEPIRSTASDAPSCTSSTSSSECGSFCAEHAGGVGGVGGCGGLTAIPARQANLHFTTEVAERIAEADLVLIAVNTPTKYRGAGAGRATDMTSFEAVTAVVAQHARPGAIIVEKSTVPCRTAQLVQETVSLSTNKRKKHIDNDMIEVVTLTLPKKMAIHRPGVHFEILSNPEFLAAGTAVNDLLYPDRVLIGSSATPSGHRAAEALALVYAAWVPRKRIVTTNAWSSELAKLVANSMLAQRVSSINSIAAICERTGADVGEVSAAIGRDPRIGGRFLQAGIGFGGSCFKKDVLSLTYLAESLGLPEVAEYWAQVVKMNEYARDRFSRRVLRCLNNTLVGKKLTVLGYAFKKNTSDTRESPALEIIRTLVEEGPREIAVFDPCCNPIVVREEIGRALRRGGGSGDDDDAALVRVYDSPYEACADSDAILIATEFDEFRTAQQKPAAVAAATADAAAHQAEVDPRPFERLEPTELDLLRLHKFLEQPDPSPSPSTDADAQDPLRRLVPEPACAADCPDCRAERGGQASLHEAYRARERLDWARIAYRMRKPRWVFDGRNVVDPAVLGRLGMRVESVGRQGLMS
ncbi:uncharacterized protein E0L32_008687 [Thyridium curvatum]|uniref:UDP-glucose 6-dehydrogenase n=1 Tax=Thyridium curvatum TaxID=1093900 RepID=A0A507AKU4_9PEZI|nr:uncharacterized protein E0L32_008687 [Thyridium curvatum]TPX10282.1 hypothetical protein E0L32_008687 [Thyridium curvatum]